MIECSLLSDNLAMVEYTDCNTCYDILPRSFFRSLVVPSISDWYKMNEEINEDFGKTGFIESACLNEVKWMTECAAVAANMAD